MSIYNAIGRLVKKLNKIDIKGLAPGVYYGMVEDEKMKFVK